MANESMLHHSIYPALDEVMPEAEHPKPPKLGGTNPICKEQ